MDENETSPDPTIIGPVLEDTIGPLSTKIPPRGGSSGSLDAPQHRMQTTSMGRTSPVTPPGRCTSPGSPMSPLARGVAAPASAVDDVREKFGRPRARSLSRRDSDKRNSLPAWEEEGEEGNMPCLEDRRRSVSMSVVEPFALGPATNEEERRRAHSQTKVEDSWRQKELEAAWRARDTEEVKLYKQCKRPGCHQPPVMGEDGQTAYLCREHKRPGMVNVTGYRCERRGCNLAPSYGFPNKGRQRCFSHKEPGMMHVLGSAGSSWSLTVNKAHDKDEPVTDEEPTVTAPAHTTPSTATVKPRGRQA